MDMKNNSNLHILSDKHIYDYLSVTSYGESLPVTILKRVLSSKKCTLLLETGS